MKTLWKVIRNLWENDFLFKGFNTIGLAIAAFFAIWYIRAGDYESTWYLIGLYAFVDLTMIIGTWIADRDKY